MSCNALSAAELKDYQEGCVEFGIVMPEFARPDLIRIDQERIAGIAQGLGCSTLRVVTEAGPVSDRTFGAVLSDNDWMPRLGNTLSNKRDVPIVRVAEVDTSIDDERDWIIINTMEINDRFQEAEHRAHAQTGRFTSFMEITTKPIQFTWSSFINSALKDGLRALAAEKRSKGKLSVFDQYGVRLLTAGKMTLAHSHLAAEKAREVIE